LFCNSVRVRVRVRVRLRVRVRVKVRVRVRMGYGAWECTAAATVPPVLQRRAAHMTNTGSG
jgi:hypothetical protein